MIRITFVLALLTLSGSAQAPQSSPANPELPTNLTTTITLQELNRDPEKLHSVRLAPNDERATAKIVGEFARTFRGYGMGLDRGVITLQEFILMRDALIVATRAELQKRLTKDGWSRLNAYIDGEAQKIHPVPPSVPRGPQVET